MTDGPCVAPPYRGEFHSVYPFNGSLWSIHFMTVYIALKYSCTMKNGLIQQTVKCSNTAEETDLPSTYIKGERFL